MLSTYTYKVAGLAFDVCAPATWDMEQLLPSFRPFRKTGMSQEEKMFCLIINGEKLHEEAGIAALLDESASELGRISLWREHTSFRMDIHTRAGHCHSLRISQSFASATASLCPDDPFRGEALATMLQALFSQTVLSRHGVLLHAAAVAHKGKAYLFMGKSGTGKSTHAGLWIKSVPDCKLLNDDNPVVRIESGHPLAYGTPWSGKTPCYKDEGYELAGVARLRQSRINSFQPKRGIEAFVTILPGCAVFPQATDLHTKLCDTLAQLTDHITVGAMECRPDKVAARTCAKALGAVRTLKRD